MEEGEEDQGAAWYVFMVNLIKKLNTRTKKQQSGTNETVLSGADTHRQKTTTHKHQVGTGYLSMVLKQRQRLTAASDWEPYQAKQIEIQT